MGRLTVTVPAPFSDCLACAGARAYARKASLWMRNNGDSAAICAGEELLAVSYLVPCPDGRREFCLAVRPAARRHMAALCRLAHSTLRALTDDGVVVFCRVYPGNRSGERMAAMVGFERDGEEWVFGGERHVRHNQGAFRRR